MKNEPITLLVDAAGKNARPVNPHPTKINDGIYEYENRNHLSFEATVKYIPLTTPQIPNSVIKGVEVWQYETTIEKIWHTVSGFKKRHFEVLGNKIRTAYEPLPIEEKEQVKEEDKLIQLARNEADIIYSILDEKHDVYAQGFMIGYNHATTCNNLVSLDKVIEMVEQNIRNINGNGHTVLTREIVETLENLLTQLKTLK